MYVCTPKEGSKAKKGEKSNGLATMRYSEAEAGREAVESGRLRVTFQHTFIKGKTGENEIDDTQ